MCQKKKKQKLTDGRLTHKKHICAAGLGSFTGTCWQGGGTSRNFDGAMDWLNQTRLGQTMLACECSSATVWPDTRLLFLEAQPLKKGCGVRHSSTDTIVPLLASNRTQVGACASTSGADQHLPVLTLIKHRVSACPHRRADYDIY